MDYNIFVSSNGYVAISDIMTARVKGSFKNYIEMLEEPFTKKNGKLDKDVIIIDGYHGTEHTHIHIQKAKQTFFLSILNVFYHLQSQRPVQLAVPIFLLGTGCLRGEFFNTTPSTKKICQCKAEI